MRLMRHKIFQQGTVIALIPTAPSSWVLLLLAGAKFSAGADAEDRLGRQQAGMVAYKFSLVFLWHKAQQCTVELLQSLWSVLLLTQEEDWVVVA